MFEKGVKYIMNNYKKLYQLIKHLSDEQIEKFITLYHQELNEEYELPGVSYHHQAE